MGETANISFKDDDEEIFEWMEDQHEEGPFRNRSHVVIWALEKAMRESGDKEPLT